MKAGILTFHEANNYGAMVQGYALRQTLASLGAEAEFVAFDTENAKPKPSFGRLAGVPAFVNKLNAEAEKRNAKFDAFRNKYLTISDRYPVNDARRLNEDYDLFIAGSDQIWNFAIPDTDERYFLPFAENIKKFSYAASFGSEEVPKEKADWCAMQLKSFNRISVREQSGTAWVKKAVGRDAEVHLDPTLLLAREDWDKLTEPVDGAHYVFCYTLQYDPVMMKRVSAYASEHGLEIRSVSAAFMPQLGLDAWSKYGVTDWISLVKHASCVFTNSFHGTAFSLIYGKPLVVSLLKGELTNRNGRIIELLEKGGMTACIDGEPFALGTEEFEKRFGTEKKHSVDYLKSILNMNNN